MAHQENIEDRPQGVTLQTALWYGLTTIPPAVVFACGTWFALRVKSVEIRLIYFAVVLVLTAGLLLVISRYVLGRNRVQSTRRRHLINATLYEALGAGYLVLSIRSLTHAPNAWPIWIFPAGFLLLGVNHLRRAYTIQEADPPATS